MDLQLHTLQVNDARLEPVAAKVLAGERLNADDGLALYESHDLLAVGWLANHVREKKHGNVTYFNVNRHINPTNVCVAHCKLCAFGRSPDAPGAYNFALDEIYKRAGDGVAEGATEFHIVGGLHPDLPFEYYLDLIRGLKQRFPQVHLKAFTMVEVGYYSRISKLSIRDTLLAMKEAGVDSLPGGGAEIFHPARPQNYLRPQSQRPALAGNRAHRARNRPALQRHHALRPHRNERRARGPLAAASRIRRTRRTDSSPSFRWRFIRRIPGSRIFLSPPASTILKAIAVSRLLLDNFDHIKAYWIMLTPRIAQVALRFGANDLDGTVVEEKIYHDAGATTPEFMTRAELERLIRAAGRIPVERDTLYNPVDRAKNADAAAARSPGRNDGFIPATSLTLNV